jgi:hypothetical protein
MSALADWRVGRFAEGVRGTVGAAAAEPGTTAWFAEVSPLDAEELPEGATGP